MRWLFLFLILSVVSCKTNSQSNDVAEHSAVLPNKGFKLLENGDTLTYVNKTELEWNQELSPQEFYVLRKKGTERSFTGEYWDNKKEGLYTCRACDLPLFASDTKYKSGTGWPSFWKPVNEEFIRRDTDYDLGYARTEVMCDRCGGHLGHVFKDGPPPTGLRYCINSVSLKFEESSKE